MASLVRLIKEDYRRRKKTAAQSKITDILKDIEANPAKFAVSSSLTDNRSWLHFASHQGAHTCVKKLLECDAEVNGRDNVSTSHFLLVPRLLMMAMQLERTPLHHAAFSTAEGAAETVEVLLDHGADPNSRDAVRGASCKCDVGV